MVVGSDTVGLGGPGFVSMSPARIRLAASHCGDPHGWLTEKRSGASPNEGSGGWRPSWVKRDSLIQFAAVHSPSPSTS